MDGKFLRGNMRIREGFWLNRPNRVLAQDGQGNQIPRVAVGEEFDQISKMWSSL